MTPRVFLSKALFILVCSMTLTAGAFATDGFTISEKILNSFKQTFPDAQQVKWLEQADRYTVNFKENGILTKIDYDKDGNFISSLRYYTEKNLPINILCRLQKKYADKKVFGVTEMTSESTVEYYIKLEDDQNWITVKSNADGNMQVVEKYRKAP
jgi:Ni,Fe-hydrogenase III component G